MMNESENTSKRESSKSDKMSEWDEVSVIEEPDSTECDSGQLAQSKEELETQNQNLSMQVRFLKISLGISWLLFFNIIAFKNLQGGTLIIGVLEIILIIIYMKVTGDEILVEIYKDFLDVMHVKNGKQEK